MGSLQKCTEEYSYNVVQFDTGGKVYYTYQQQRKRIKIKKLEGKQTRNCCGAFTTYSAIAERMKIVETVEFREDHPTVCVDVCHQCQLLYTNERSLSFTSFSCFSKSVS